MSVPAVGSWPSSFYPSAGQSPLNSGPTEDLSATHSTDQYSYDVASAATISLSSDASHIAANSGAGTIAVDLAKVIQSATTVDAKTGQREIAKGTVDSLTSALSFFLKQDGFTSDQAAAATSKLVTALSSNGKLDLFIANGSSSATNSVSGEGTPTAAGGYYAYASASSSASTNAQQLTISFDFSSGTISVSSENKDLVNTTSDTLDYRSGPQDGGGPGAGPPKVDNPTSTLTSNAGLSETQTITESSISTIQTEQVDASNIGSLVGPFQGLNSLLQPFLPGTGGSDQRRAFDSLAETTQPILSAFAIGTKDSGPNGAGSTPSDLLQGLSLNSSLLNTLQITNSLLQSLLGKKADGDQSSAPSNSTKDFSANQGQRAQLSTRENGASPSGQLTYSKIVAVHRTDPTGRRDTLYQRPDGTLGKITQQPVRITA
jgi:hypothetical protein